MGKGNGKLPEPLAKGVPEGDCFTVFLFINPDNGDQGKQAPPEGNREERPTYRLNVIGKPKELRLLGHDDINQKKQSPSEVSQTKTQS